MADIIKLDMTDIWASGGDKVAPTPTKIAQGWLVEVVPRQTWNWFENRQDQNIAYLLQKGFPEWDVTTEYVASKSWVNRSGTIYKAILTGINKDPVSQPTYWVKAFPESSTSLEALRTLTPATDRIPYFTGGTTAAVATFTAFARTLIDDVDATAARATLDAQQASSVLTALATVTPATNKLPYFSGTSTAATTDITAFARTLLDDNDAVAARLTLGVDSAVEVSDNLVAGLATKQPLDVTLTALAGVTATINKLPYFNGTDTATVTDLSAFGRTLIDDADAAAGRVTLDVPSNSELTTGLAGKQPLDATLTALAGLTSATNTLAYFTGVDTLTTTALTTFARSILDDADAAGVRGTIDAPSNSDLTTGLAGKQPLQANLTAYAALSTATDTMAYFTGTSGTVSTTALTAFARSLLGQTTVANFRAAISAVSYDSITGAALIPVGTQAQRPVSPSNGMFRYNSDTGKFEGYQAGAWTQAIGGYTQTNIVGVVGQTAGIPTGAILETGTNAGGTYVRYADGTQICWKSGISISGGTAANGTNYRSVIASMGSLPAAFLTGTAPVIVCNGLDSSTGGGWAGQQVFGSATTWGSWSVYTTVAIAGNLQLNLMAIGRWF